MNDVSISKRRRSLFYEDFQEVGYLAKTFKTAGHLRISIDEDYLEQLSKESHYFILINGQHIPFCVESLELDARTLVKFQDVDSIEEASKLSNSKIFLPKYLVQREEIQSSSEGYIGLINFTLYNGDTEIGVIENVVEMPGQFMAIVNYQGKDCFIPIHEELIVDINQESGDIVFNLPEGILDL